MEQQTITNDPAQCDAKRLYRESIIYDMVSPLFAGVYPRGEDYIVGGVTAIGAMVSYYGAVMTVEEGFCGTADPHNLIRRMPDKFMFIGWAWTYDSSQIPALRCGKNPST